MNYHKTIKRLMERIPMQAGERVIANLHKTDFKDRWQELIDSACHAAKMQKELEDLGRTINAKTILFWDDIKKSSELAESSDDRGMALGLRYDDKDNFVLVEYSPPEDKHASNPFLKFLGGLQEDA